MRYPLSQTARPRLEVLEGRAVPAGNVTASLVGGRLAITGDDQANGLTLLVTGTEVTVTPDASTSVNGQPAGTAVTLPGAATSLAANLGGGNDSLGIDGFGDFVLSGAAHINLGSGNNTLTLATLGRITLGGLAVTSGPGSNTVHVFPGVGSGSTVTGPVSFAFGPGGSNAVFLNRTSFQGPAGVRVTAGLGGSNAVSVFAVTVSRTLSVNTGGSSSTSSFGGDTLGGLAVTGGRPNLTLQSDTISGNLSEIGSLAATGTMRDVTVTGNVTVRSGGSDASLSTFGTVAAGNVTLASPASSSLTPSGTFTAGNVTLTSGTSSSLTTSFGAAVVAGNVTLRSGGTSSLNPAGTLAAGNVTLISGTSSSLTAPSGTPVTVGNVTLRSGGTSSLTPAGTFEARNVSVSGPVSAQFQNSGGLRATIDGNLSATSRGSASVQFGTGALSEVRGNVVERGGILDTSFVANGQFKADRNVTVTTAPNNASTQVSIVGSLAGAAIQGNLTVATGNGPLGLTLTNLTVGGATRVTSGAGADTLTIDATTFKGAFAANTGRGDDTFNVAQQTGSSAPVTFGGPTTINAGADNDTLRLGRSAAAGGDANSRVVFSVPTSRLNGGTGFNTYFKSTAQVTGPADFLNWTNA